MASQRKELKADQLQKTIDFQQFEFKSTQELPALEDVIGQDRAVKAVEFGIGIGSPGYHMYALGPSGTGKTTLIQDFLKRKSKQQPVPDDWCYVNNFNESDKPKALRLPSGMGCQFEEDMDNLVGELKNEIPRAFESEEYEKEKKQIQQKYQEKREQLFKEMEEKAQEKGFSIVQTPRGLMTTPVKDGEVISPEQVSKLDAQTRENLEQKQKELQEEMRETMKEVQDLQKEAKEEISELDRQVIGYAVEHLINSLKEKYNEQDDILDFLEEIRKDILENADELKQAEQKSKVQQQLPFLMQQQAGRSTFDRFDNYRVNLIVDNCDLEGAPVILESNPTHANLVGRIEHQAQLGALVTNFQMIKAGALHQANGGYLIIEAQDLLRKPLSYEALKRSLKNREVEIESIQQAIGAISTRSLEPEAIPLEIKVVIIGDPILYYLLYQYDEDFQELFKVKADFAVQMDWEKETADQYAQFIGTICEEQSLTHFAPSGVAKIVEEGFRMVSDQNRISTKFGEIVDLIQQASYWAGQNGNDLVQGEDVKKAIDEMIYRSNRIEERLQEMIEEGKILIDTEGTVQGQVNGISVLPLGDYAFGKPSRITSRTHVGKEGVVNIDRKAELGGKIHNKGVMILTGYLGGKYAEDVPLALSASITFEQLYEEVEGDSASSAELYALLSSLSGYPIRQGFAVTGSVNQRGEVQAIGGVNEKIEGFYKTCKHKGLTGDQGVIIPESNVDNLMLRDEVVEAVENGQFHIYPVTHIDLGIELLTGKKAGQRQPDGSYPEDTVNWAVQNRLLELAEKVRDYSQGENEKEE